MRRIFFADFDGTITRDDTCVAMLKRFAASGWMEINELWEKKQLTTEECANLTFKLFQANPDEVRQFLESMEIDKYFSDFVDLCQQRGHKVVVLSDGYDFNIRTIFKKYGIDLPFFANRLAFDGSFKMECAYPNPDCRTCGTCKSMLIETLREKGAETVYIGDGYSDTCPAKQADLVFAKGALYQYCLETGIPALYFENFQDIITQIKQWKDF